MSVLILIKPVGLFSTILYYLFIYLYALMMIDDPTRSTVLRICMNLFCLTLRPFIIVFCVEISLIAFSCLLFFHFAFQIHVSTYWAC